MVSKLLGGRAAKGLQLLLILLMLLGLGLALLNPTFESGMGGAILSVALIPVLIGSLVTGLVLRRSSQLPDKSPGLNPTVD